MVKGREHDWQHCLHYTYCVQKRTIWSRQNVPLYDQHFEESQGYSTQSGCGLDADVNMLRSARGEFLSHRWARWPGLGLALHQGWHPQLLLVLTCSHHKTNVVTYSKQKIFRCSCIIELSSNSTRLCGRELIVLQRTPPMFDEFSVHAQRKSGGLDEEHSISVYWGSNSFWYAKRCSIYLALNEPT